MTKEAKMLAVVKAARELLLSFPAGTPTTPEMVQVQIELNRLDAFDALTKADAETVTGETVDIRAVCLQAVNDKLAAVPKPRSYEMAHYCMGLEDAAMAIQSKIIVTLPITREGGQ